MKTFTVKNFERFQHYKDRAPPWIKLYNELLDDYEFGCLPDASKMHLIAIWLLASRSENKIPFDPEWVGRRINANTTVDLDLLARSGFIVVDQELRNAEQVASKPLAECLPREREEGEVEKRKNGAADAANSNSSPNPEKLYFDTSAQLGKNGRSLAGALLKAKGGNVLAAHSALLAAFQKSSPEQYIGAIIRGRGNSPEDLRARGEAW